MAVRESLARSVSRQPASDPERLPDAMFCFAWGLPAQEAAAINRGASLAARISGRTRSI
jgi:hypothetical protein